MRLDILVDNETAENYNYTTTIDSDTYNKIKLAYDNDDTGTREVYIAQETSMSGVFYSIMRSCKKGKMAQKKRTPILRFTTKRNEI